MGRFDDLAALLGRGLDTGADQLKNAGRRLSPGDVTMRQPSPGGGSLRDAPMPTRPPPQPQVKPAPWGRRALGVGGGVGLAVGGWKAGEGLGNAISDGGIAGAFTGSSPEEGGVFGGLFGSDGEGSGIGGGLLPLALLLGGGYLVYKATKKPAAKQGAKA